MSVNVLVDMNLSPRWAALLSRNGWPSVHWLQVGDPAASDRIIMDWAVNNGYVVLTHDLDFGTILATTRAAGPSVIQLRGQDVLPEVLGIAVLAVLRRHDAELLAGALVVVDGIRHRVRFLPF